MKKRWAFILTAIFICSIFSSCGKGNTKTPEPLNTTSDPVQIQQITDPIDPAEVLDVGDTDVEGKLTDVSDSATDAKTDTADVPDSITYIKYFNSYLPISCIKDGRQILTGDGGRHSDVESRLVNFPKADELYIYSAVDMYTQGSATPFDTPPRTDTFLSKIPGDIIAISGRWDPFIAKIRYIRYTPDDQPQSEIWYSYFKEKIHAVSEHTPVIITEAWFFDLNDDGVEEVFVNANNTFFSSEDNVPNPPHSLSSAVYSFSALFIDGLEPLEIDAVIYEIGNEPINEQQDIYVSYMLSDESSDWSEHFVTAIQYDSRGDLIESPIFNLGEYDRRIEPKIVIADIDGDGQAELITLQYGIYSPIIVYRIDDSGKLVESFRIGTPA